MPRITLDNGVALNVVRSGSAGDVPVVFVNGLTMTTAAWAAVADGLGDAWATVCYDCRGQGESEAPPGPYPPEQHAADLKLLLDALAIDRAHLVGLSNGGLVAGLLAGEIGAGGRILSLTTIDSFITVDPLLKTILRSWKAALDAGGPALRFDVATPWVWGHAFLAEHLDEVLAFREQAAAADPAAVRGLIDGLLGFGSAGSVLRAYPGPLLALVGRDDVLTPPRYSREIVDWARHGRLVELDRAGHAAPIERPEAVLRELSRFLEDPEAPAAGPERRKGGSHGPN